MSVMHDGRAYLRTWSSSGKAKRVLQGVLVPAYYRLTNKTTVHYELLPPDAA
jgi:hypothetical protein